ncbi:MAG: hypothetical protein AAF572_02535 [Cyanobacteria bacterium P01_B01_bin.77]
MTTQTMTNELTLDQLDSVSGGADPLTIAVGASIGATAGLLIVVAAASAYVVGKTSGVKADENGNGDYRTGPQNSPNSPPNPFG